MMFNRKGLIRYKDIIIDNMYHGIVRDDDDVTTRSCSLCNKEVTTSDLIWYANAINSPRDLACFDCIMYDPKIYICALCFEPQLILEEDNNPLILEDQRTVCNVCKHKLADNEPIKTTNLYHNNRKEGMK